jgi:hypothetical protein
MFGKQYRFRSTENIIEELRRYNDRKISVFFYDDNFAANRQRAKALLEAMIRERFKFTWTTQVRADVARDPDLVRLMKKAGCHTVYIGFESVNPYALEDMNKKQKLLAESTVTEFFLMGASLRYGKPAYMIKDEKGKTIKLSNSEVEARYFLPVGANIFVAEAYHALAREAEAASNEPDRVLRKKAVFHYTYGMECPDFNRCLFQARARVELAELFLQGGEGGAAARQAGIVMWQLPPHLPLPPDERGRAAEVLGTVELRAENPEAALLWLNLAVRLRPQATGLHLLRARALLMIQDRMEKAGDWAKARAACQGAAEALQQVAPSDPAHRAAQELARTLRPPANPGP